jgi:hypothetical protein
LLIHNNCKKNSKSFIREIGAIFISLEINKVNLITDIQSIITKFKDDKLYVEQNTENELIINCLNNNHDYKMIQQISLITYAGTQ